ncbi:hypothetical protein BU204_12460 [Actinophytocola xanthii]|uniref:RCK N-terminal domain-containing protein n=1 Tax=Actinophytocola xanthii TaxID=1912961 RepID=A0A1Q8CS97_9PSEU|nr:hypothetical protein BU204_12460 [Actinophytocola xanthii]
MVGCGVTGLSAARQLLRCGLSTSDLVTVEVRPDVVAEAAHLELRVICGDGTQHATLGRVVTPHTRRVIVTAGPDETAVMITMLARAMSPTATVVTAVRDVDLVPFARRAGADHVLATSDWAGRALALMLDGQGRT